MAGGQLEVGIWGEHGPVLYAAHGLTSNHLCFEQLAQSLGRDFRIIAPDLRGRGRSADISGPFGMPAHADDAVAVLDQLGVGQVDLLLGHSMGGFVAVVSGARAPDRFRRILLLDGGLMLFDEPPAGMSIEQLTAAVVGPSMQRLDMRFDSPEAYLEFWHAHPALIGNWSAGMDRHFAYDLVGEPPELRASTNKAAVLADVESELTGDLVPDALRALTQPVRMLRAEGGILSDEPLYTEQAVAQWIGQMHDFSFRTVRGVNHITLVQGPAGIAEVAAEIRALTAGDIT